MEISLCRKRCLIVRDCHTATLFLRCRHLSIPHFITRSPLRSAKHPILRLCSHASALTILLPTFSDDHSDRFADRFIRLSLLFRDRPDQSTTTSSCRRVDARNDSQPKEIAHIAATPSCRKVTIAALGQQDQVPDFSDYVITLVRQQASLSSSLSVI